MVGSVAQARTALTAARDYAKSRLVFGRELAAFQNAKFELAADPGREIPPGDARPVMRQVLDAFWCHPPPDEALAWSAYPYDSDPVGNAIRAPRPAAHRRRPRRWRPGMVGRITRAEQPRRAGRQYLGRASV